MKYTELKKSIAVGAEKIYLLEGDDAYFRTNGEQLIKNAFLQFPELNFTVFEGENLKGAALTGLVSAVRNYPFMAEKRLIKVTEFYPSESEFETYLKPLFADFPPSTILIIVNSAAKKGVDFKRKHAVTYVDCNRLDTETVARWAYLTLKKAGIAAPVAACENIAEYCLCDMSRVSVEVNKLIDYKGGGALTLKEVEDLVYKDAEYRLYELTGAAARKDYTKFCVIADELIKKSGDEIFVLGGLFNYFRNLLTICMSCESDSVLAGMLKMKEYGVKKSREQANALGDERLSELVSYIYSAVSGIKSGKITPERGWLTVTEFIFFG